MKSRYVIISFLLFSINLCKAQQDTLNVMAYNVLHYGDGCQGSNSFLHRNLKTIIQYTNPDILGLVKVQAIKVSATDFDGLSPIGFADSIIQNALDPATFSGKYAYCRLTRASNDLDGDMDLLFYNQTKLGCVSVTNLCYFEEDFDLYKLYYTDPNLATTHDTTFIYVVLNHTDSGTLANRNQQDADVTDTLKVIFYHLPNIISMGDFNTQISSENGYLSYTAPADTSFIFDDPPFHPDSKFTYPLAWKNNTACSGYLNTSTRSSSTVPNNCGASGGAKDWIEHIFLSKWIVDSIDYITYIKNSYQTVGNDGKHFNLSINDSTSGPKNTSTPSNVINALYHLSDKYPITVKLRVTDNTTGTGPVNPVNSVNEIAAMERKIFVSNPIHNSITFHFPCTIIGEKICMNWYDISGRLLSSEEFVATTGILNRITHFTPGVYLLTMQIDNYCITKRIIQE